MQSRTLMNGLAQHSGCLRYSTAPGPHLHCGVLRGPVYRAFTQSSFSLISSGVSVSGRPSQAPQSPLRLAATSTVRSAPIHHNRRVSMHSAASHESITISSLQDPFQCNVLQPVAASQASPGSPEHALILLSDIFGQGTTDTLNISQVLANELGCSVYVPDTFRKQPWPQGKPVKGNEDEYEQWRGDIGGSWPVDVSMATAAHAEAAGARYTVLVGFCFGGGKVVDVLAAVNAATANAPQSTAPDLSAADSSIVAGVAFYGTRIDREALARVRKPLALYFASEDPLVPLSDVEDFRKVLEARMEDSAVATSTGSSQHYLAAAVVHVEQGQQHGFVHQAGKGAAGAADRVRGLAVEFIQHH